MSKKSDNKEVILNLEDWLNSLDDFKLPKRDELPAIDLYMDQVLTYISSKLKPLIEDDNFLSASMINNYVKGKVVKAPVGKKYDSETMEQLFCITLVKQVLSIAEIKEILEKPVTEHYDQLIDYERNILKQSINEVKEEINEDNSNTNLYKIALKLAIESEIKKIIVSKIIEATK